MTAYSVTLPVANPLSGGPLILTKSQINLQIKNQRPKQTKNSKMKYSSVVTYTVQEKHGKVGATVENPYMQQEPQTTANIQHIQCVFPLHLNVWKQDTLCWNIVNGGLQCF